MYKNALQSISYFCCEATFFCRPTLWFVIRNHQTKRLAKYSTGEIKEKKMHVQAEEDYGSLRRNLNICNLFLWLNNDQTSILPNNTQTKILHWFRTRMHCYFNVPAIAIVAIEIGFQSLQKWTNDFLVHSVFIPILPSFRRKANFVYLKINLQREKKNLQSCVKTLRSRFFCLILSQLFTVVFHIFRVGM